MASTPRTRIALLALAAASLLTGCTDPAQHTATTRATTSPSRPAAASPAAPTPTLPTAPSSPTVAPATLAAAPVASAPVPTAPPSMVTAWVRHDFHGMSFVVPADRAKTQIDDLYPTGYALYNWNNPMVAGIPPVSVGVLAEPNWPGVGQPSSLAHPTTVRGCTDAYTYTLPQQSSEPRTVTQVQCRTATMFYSVNITVPRTADGNQIAKTWINSLRVEG